MKLYLALAFALLACGDNVRSPDAPDPDLDPQAPVARIISPAPGAILDASTVPVRVRLRDDRALVRASLLAGGATYAIDPNAVDGNGEVTVDVTLPDGEQSLELLAGDGEGLEARAVATIVVDTVAPTATILSPSTPHVAGEPAIDVRIRVTDAVGLASATLAVSGVAQSIDLATLDAAGETTLAITAPLGTSDLALVAIDRVGRSTTATATVVVDVEAPALTVLAPRRDAHETRRLLRAELADPSGIASVTYAVNGGAAIPVAITGTPTTLVVREALPLVAGANTVAITITDAVGHVRTETVAFRYGLTTTAGGSHSGAIVAGELQTWGRYNVGQLGLGGTLGDAASRLAPETVPSFGTVGTTVAAIAFNQNTSLAVRSDGSLWTWGANGDGQLGQGDTAQRSAPAQLAGTTVAYAALGYSHGLAIRTDGAVIAWGKNAAGQAGVDGNGTATDDQLVPVEVAIPAAVVEVAAGSEHSLALTVDGRVFVWGRNTYGNLGGGTVDADRHPVPTAVPNLTDVIDIATGRDHVVALRADGSVMTWGLGASGQLGYGAATGPSEDRTSPVAVVADAAGTALVNVQAVFANGNTSYALVGAGAAVQYWGWGQNFSGQLATGATSSEEWFARRAVVYTPGATPVFLDEMVSFVSIGVGATHTIARTATGGVFSWGWNFRGSLGVPAIANAWAQTVAVEVALVE